MRYPRLAPSRSLLTGIAVILTLACASSAQAKLYTHYTAASVFGHDVNRTEVENHGGREREDACAFGSADVCQYGSVSGEAGGFFTPQSVAVGPISTGGDIYVVDAVNGRVQVFAPDHEFLFMFGWEVNATTKGNICTKASGDKCQAGQAGNGVEGELHEPYSVAVDQETGDVYVYERAGRVDMFDREGNFVWTVSGFAEEVGGGNALAVAGPPSKQVLYVGEEGRVRELDPATGASIGEVPLSALPFPDGWAKALAVDKSGDLYIVNTAEPGAAGVGVYELNPAGELLRTVDPGGAVWGLALDPFGRIAISERTEEGRSRGVLFEASSGRELSTFALTGEDVAFNPAESEADDELYTSSVYQMVEALDPVPVAEPVTDSCKDQTATSLTLTGEVNPEAVEGTTAGFRYGNGLARATPFQALPTSEGFEPVEATVTGLLPNEAYPYTLVAEDSNWSAARGNPALVGETETCETAFVAPATQGEPSSSNVGFSSADMFAEVNPENAQTKFGFEYGVCPSLEGCPSRRRTPASESKEYAAIAAMRSATELQPETTYRYRLYAESENRLHSQTATAYGGEGAFTTLPAPSPSATTAGASTVTASSAVLAGTVDPDDAGATWSFQVGVYNPEGTVFTTIVSGATGTQSSAEARQYLLSGLQPGTEYAYRMVIQSAYTPGGKPLAGETVLFNTQGLPAVLIAPQAPPLLAVPAIEFPAEAKSIAGCAKGLVRGKADRCVKQRKAQSHRARLRHGKAKRRGALKSARHRSNKKMDGSRGK